MRVWSGMQCVLPDPAAANPHPSPPTTYPKPGAPQLVAAHAAPAVGPPRHHPHYAGAHRRIHR